MATAQIDGLGPDYESVNGTLAITRRLSDKVLAAFNHAYATDEVDVASKLRAVPQVTEAKRPKGDKSGGYDATTHADLWVGFVEERNSCKAFCEKTSAKVSDLRSTQEKIKTPIVTGTKSRSQTWGGRIKTKLFMYLFALLPITA